MYWISEINIRPNLALINVNGKLPLYFEEIYQAYAANFILAWSNIGLKVSPGHCRTPLCSCRSSETWMHVFLSILTQINL